MKDPGKIDERTEKEMRKLFGGRSRDVDGNRQAGPFSGSTREGAGRSGGGFRRRDGGGSGWKDIGIDLLFIALIVAAVFMYEMSVVWRYVVTVSAILFYFRISARMRFARFGKSAEKVLNIILILLILLALTLLHLYY